MPLEELDLQNNVEKVGEQHNINSKEGEFKEKDELPKKITDSEELQYLWEEYDRLEQEGKSSEEISEIMQEAEKTYQMLKNFEKELEEIHEKQEKQDLESVDHKNEEEPEDYRKEVESLYEAEYFIDAEIQLQAAGKSSGEATEEMQKVEEKYEFKEKVEELHEKQEKDKYNLVDCENEEDEDDQREEIDRVDVIEGVVEAEEEFHTQGKSQKEIDEETERIVNNFYKHEIEEQPKNNPGQEINKELKTEETEITEPELTLEEKEQINPTSVESSDQNIEINPEMENSEILEEIEIGVDDSTNHRGSYQESMEKVIEKEHKLENEESEEKEYELIQQLYHQQTGRSPRYRGRETKGYSQWLEHQKLKTKNAKEKEEKEQEEERWKKILKDWIEESKDEMLNSELKLVLKEIIQKFEILEELYREFVNLTETEREQWLSKLIKLQNQYPIHLHLYQFIYGFKVYAQESHPWDIIRIKNRFLRHLSEKFKKLVSLKKASLDKDYDNSNDNKNRSDDLKNTRTIMNLLSINPAIKMIKRGGYLTSEAINLIIKTAFKEIDQLLDEKKKNKVFNQYFLDFERILDFTNFILTKCRIKQNRKILTQGNWIILILGLIKLKEYKTNNKFRPLIINDLIKVFGVSHKTASLFFNRYSELIQKCNDLIIFTNKEDLFNYLNLIEDELVKEGKYVTWDYFKENNKKNIILFGKKIFHEWRNQWIKKNNQNKTFNDYINQLNLHPATDPLEHLETQTIHELTIDDIVKPIISKIKRKIIGYSQYSLDIYLSNNIITSKKRSTKLYENRSKYLWHGFVYKITQIRRINGDLIPKSQRKCIIGYSTTTFNIRWSWYKHNAINDDFPGSFYALLRKLYHMGEALDLFDLNSDGIGYLGKYFTWEVLEVCWDEFILKNKEKAWIDRFDATNPIRGFNDNAGGGGGSKVNLDMIFIIDLIARGYNKKQIRLLYELRKKVSISYDVIKERIREIWGSLYNARIKYLKPILKKLIEHGYNLLEMEPRFGGICFAQTISEWCKQFFGKNFTEIRPIIIRNKLKKLVIRGFSLSQIYAEIPKISKMSLRQGKEYLGFWGGLKKAREVLMKPLLEQYLRKDITNKEIVKKMGFEKVRIGYRSWIMGEEILIYYTNYFWGKKPKELRRDFKHY